MKVTLTSTSHIVEVNGHPARVWEGTTESGIPVFALIPRIATRADGPLAQFEAELEAMGTSGPAGSPEARNVWPNRLVL